MARLHMSIPRTTSNFWNFGQYWLNDRHRHGMAMLQRLRARFHVLAGLLLPPAKKRQHPARPNEPQPDAGYSAECFRQSRDRK
jgi:hypothetical protein